MAKDDSIESLFEQKEKEQEAFIFEPELLLAKSVYNTNAQREHVEALAQTIQNIMIVETGTYPNQPQLGVGIENYEFEFLDNQTLTELKEKVDGNLKKFIPTFLTVNFEVDTIQNNMGKNILFFSFLVSDNNNYYGTSQINMLIGKEDNGKVISKILL
jgi:phage baseplate assembly protein W